MYRYWSPERAYDKSVMILVSPRRNKLTNERVLSRVEEMGTVQEIILHKNGRPVGNYYYVVVNGYNDAKGPIENTSPSYLSFLEKDTS